MATIHQQHDNDSKNNEVLSVGEIKMLYHQLLGNESRLSSDGQIMHLSTSELSDCLMDLNSLLHQTKIKTKSFKA